MERSAILKDAFDKFFEFISFSATDYVVYSSFVVAGVIILYTIGYLKGMKREQSQHGNKEETENLKCCGNCIHFVTKCMLTKKIVDGHCYCRDGWEPDEWTLIEREEEANELNS